MRTKQILSGLLAAAALCCCMGCEQGETPSMEPASELTVYIPPYEEIWMQPVVDLYRETYPQVELRVKTFITSPQTLVSDVEAYQTLLRTELMGGKGPDVVIINEWTFENLNKMLQNVPFCD